MLALPWSYRHDMSTNRSSSTQCLFFNYFFSYNFFFVTATRTRSNAISCHPKCGNRATLPPLQRNQAGQYSRRGYRRRQPQAHSRAHLDNHPPFPGRKTRHRCCALHTKTWEIRPNLSHEFKTMIIRSTSLFLLCSIFNRNHSIKNLEQVFRKWSQWASWKRGSLSHVTYRKIGQFKCTYTRFSGFIGNSISLQKYCGEKLTLQQYVLKV